MNEEFLRNLGVTQALLNHLRDDNPVDSFRYRCCTPHNWQSSSMTKHEIVPLWECGTVISYFNVTSGFFERCSVENTNEVWSKYTSIQGLLAELFIDVYEDELETSISSKYAALFGFHGLSRLLVEINSTKKDYGHWREQFCASCH
jgi:hypothetical protein